MEPQRKKDKQLGLGRNARERDGFSLLELVVVTAVLGLLAAISIPFFQSLIKQAIYVAGKWTLSSATTSCAVNKTLLIPTSFMGTQFVSSKPADICGGTLSANYEDGCQLAINLENGNKTSSAGLGWPETYEVCNLGGNLASNNNGKDTPESSKDRFEYDAYDYDYPPPESKLSVRDDGRRRTAYEMEGAIFNINYHESNQSWVTEGETARILIIRSGDLTGTNVVTLNNSHRASQLPGKEGEDYESVDGNTITFLPGQKQHYFEVKTITDNESEEYRTGPDPSWRGEWFDIEASVSSDPESGTNAEFQTHAAGITDSTFSSPGGQVRIYIGDE